MEGKGQNKSDNPYSYVNKGQVSEQSFNEENLRHNYADSTI